MVTVAGLSASVGHVRPWLCCTSYPWSYGPMALAELLGYIVVRRYGVHAGPWFPIEGVLVALSSYAGREFMRLPMKNHLQ